MILDLEKLVDKYNLEIRGLIHIGAHTCIEFPRYERLGIENMIFYEPDTDSYEELLKRVSGCVAVNCALGNFNGDAVLYVASNGQSSSLLEPDLHLRQYPRIRFDEKRTVKVRKLDDVLCSPEKFNFIDIDVQGYELGVFKGAEKTLKGIDYIMTEVNRAELYKDCAMVEDIDDFLVKFGFSRVETDWAGTTWGDAFYIKK